MHAGRRRGDRLNSIPGLDPAPTSHRRLIAWVGGDRRPDQARPRASGATAPRTSGSALTGELVAAGTLKRLESREASQLLLRRLRSQGRRPRREPHLHLLEGPGRRRPDQQLARPGRDARRPDGPVRRLHARAHDVRRAVLHGPARLEDQRARRRDHRQPLRRRLDADHDPDGQGGAGRSSARTASSCRRCTRWASRWRPARPTLPGPATRSSTSSTSPKTREIWSYGSGYGGNALLGKKCYALRIASVMARDEGWLAEHMLILKLTSPEGRVHYIAAGLSQRLRQDQPRHAAADAAGLEGRDDWRRHLLDALRRRRPAATRSIRRPASSASRRAPATTTNANAIAALARNMHLHQCRAHRRRRCLVGGADATTPPDGLTDWKGRPWTPGLGEPAAHPNARFTAPASQCPSIAPEWEDPAGRADLGHPVRRPPR